MADPLDLGHGKNAHGSIGLIGKFPTSILSRRDRSKVWHPDHPAGTMGAAGGFAASCQVPAPEGLCSNSLGLHSALCNHDYTL